MPADKVIGRNVRLYRLARGLTQSELGGYLGVTFQQIQKYEKGFNRIGSGRLLKIADVLRIDVTALFEDRDPARSTVLPDELEKPQSFRLARAFAVIKSAGIRERLVDLIERIAEVE